MRQTLSRLRLPLFVAFEIVSFAWTAFTFVFAFAPTTTDARLSIWYPLIGFVIFALLVSFHIFGLERRFTPRMDIVFGDNGSFIHASERDSGPHTLYRVGIQNLGGKTIEDVKVSLEKLEPQGIAFGPIRLMFMHERTIGLETRQNLHPGDGPSLFVDVIQMDDIYVEVGTRQMYMCYAITGVPMNLEPRQYRLTLLAEGQDVPSVRRVFIVDFDDIGKLLFRTEDD